MLDMLEGIGNSEYNNAGDLYGIDANGITDDLLGALRNMNPIDRQKVVHQLAKPPAASKGSRAEMEKHFKELPAHIKQQLVGGELRLADTVIYSIKPVISKTIKCFETQTQKETGITNLSSAKLPKNQALLVSGIFLLAGNAATSNKDDVMVTPFTKIEQFPALMNGEFSLKANKKIIVPEGTANRVFCTDNMHGLPLGYFKLSNPRLIQDDVQIEFTIELGSMTGISATTQIYVGLHGTITTP